MTNRILPLDPPSPIIRLRGIAISLLIHSGIFGLLLHPIVFQSQAPNVEFARQSTEIVIDNKLYYITPLTAPAVLGKSSRPSIAPAGKPAPTPQPTVAQSPDPPDPRAPFVPKNFVPPDIRRDPKRVDTIVQADLIPSTVLPDAQLPSFQAWTGRLAPFRRQFVVPGQRTVPHVSAVDLDDLPAIRNPVVTSAAVPRDNPKLRLAPPPTVVDEDLPAIEMTNPALAVGDPINVLSSTSVAANPDRLVVPPNNVVGRSGAEAPGPSSNGGQPQPAATAAKGQPGGSGTGGGEVAAVSARTAPTPDTAVSSAAPAAAAAKGPNDPTLISKSPQGRFDSIVVQSSPLDQFPGGSTLLSCRPIFTVYVSIATAKDWPMYFCVQGDTAASIATGPAKPIEPPYPFTLYRPKITVPAYQKNLLVHGIVTESGTVKDVRVLPPSKPETTDIVVSALSRWVFRAATRLGAPIGVEFVLAIPAGTF